MGTEALVGHLSTQISDAVLEPALGVLGGRGCAKGSHELLGEPVGVDQTFDRRVEELIEAEVHEIAQGSSCGVAGEEARTEFLRGHAGERGRMGDAVPTVVTQSWWTARVAATCNRRR